jgi:hypothetical protein
MQKGMVRSGFVDRDQCDDEMQAQAVFVVGDKPYQ